VCARVCIAAERVYWIIGQNRDRKGKNQIMMLKTPSRFVCENS
jgi:hypothetical protein